VAAWVAENSCYIDVALADQTPRPPQEDFAALFAAAERSNAGAPRRSKLRPGDRVRGKIISLGGETVFVELENGQGEGMLDLVELRDTKGQLLAKVGDTVDAVVAEAAGARSRMLVLRRSLGRGAGGVAELAQAFQHGIPVEGTVTGVNKGGVEVTVAGTRAFCPVSQLELRHVEDPGSFVGQKLLFRITRFEEEDRRGPNIVLSRRAVLEEESRTKAAETRAKLTVGSVVSGVVTALKDYGAFIDLGGVEGMLHVSEIGFRRVARPADVLSVGQHVSVQIIKIERKNDARKSEQIALSLKALETDPWESAAQSFTEGTRVQGTVTRVTDFGAFVELAPGVEGLVHVSELSDGRSQRQTKNAVKVGEPLTVTVKSVDRERRRLSLSLGASDEPLDAEARAIVDRGAAPSKHGKLGTLADLFKNVASPAKR
jgi:small subunit ribosomal protein S1